jgi:alkylation response protein AidB-like acyl-CoA dehydrogenase
MDFCFDAAEEQWRQEVRAFLRENVTEEVRRQYAEHAGPAQALKEFERKVADRGWYGINWPVEYGGLGLSPVHQNILMHEFQYWGAPNLDLTVTSVGPMIIRHGTAANKEAFLPPIARGELRCAVGYSEPDAGTDLASLRTRAELDGDEWVINGSKIWNSNASTATHEWLCVRTDPSAAKHRGISVIMVPIDAPGIEITPLVTWSDYATYQTFFTDVRVPRDNLIGEPNEGWRYITGALALERGALTNAGDLRRAVDDLIDLARAPGSHGRRPADDPIVRRKIAQLDADVDVAVLMSLEAAVLLEQGEIPTVTVTVEKVFSSELRQRIADVGTQIAGVAGVLQASGSDQLRAFERLYRSAPLLRFGGGTNEVLRDVIATVGHGLPRSR